MQLQRSVIICTAIIANTNLFAQKDPATTEVWKPEVKVVTPGKTNTDAPSDAVILFNGTSASGWQHSNGDEAKWTVADNALTVKPGTGGIQTKQKFGDCQLHIEWRIDKNVKGDGQDRGNSGVYLQDRYEVQVLDSFGLKGENNECGGIYTKAKPAENMCFPPLVWQTYDIDFTAAQFDADGKKTKNAIATVAMT